MRGYANFRVSDSSGPFCLFSILWFCCPVRIEDFFLLCYFWDELPPWKVVGAMPSLTPLTRCYTRFKTLFKTAYLLLCDEQNWCVPFQCKPPPPFPRCHTRFKTLFKTAYLLLCDEQNWCVPFQYKCHPRSYNRANIRLYRSSLGHLDYMKYLFRLRQTNTPLKVVPCAWHVINLVQVNWGQAGEL